MVLEMKWKLLNMEIVGNATIAGLSCARSDRSEYCSSFVVCELGFICRVYAYLADCSSKCLRNEITIGLEVDVLQVEAEWFLQCLVPSLHWMSRKARDLVLVRQPPAHQQFHDGHLCFPQMVPLEPLLLEVQVPQAGHY